MSGQNIDVFVRSRPLRPKERLVIDIKPNSQEVKIIEKSPAPKNHTPKKFQFNRAFCPKANQEEVYDAVVRPLIEQVLKGFNCTVFAYGQTGTGKTFTMEGERTDENLDWEQDPNLGLIPRAISHIIDELDDKDREYTIKVSFLELYNEEAYDLLSPIDDMRKMKLFEKQKKGTVDVQGLIEVEVETKADIYKILREGSEKRQKAATLINASSSRSHTNFSITVKIRDKKVQDGQLWNIGKLNLVDLAGSENIGRSGAQDKRAREAGSINQSLLTLGRVITALVEKRSHIPYRESKLTRLLQDSLGGIAKTSMIATISPASLDLEDTLSTLEYAMRAKKITNKPEMNQQLTIEACLQEAHQEIRRLKKQLQMIMEEKGHFMDTEKFEHLQQLEQKEQEWLKADRKYSRTIAKYEKRLVKSKNKVERLTCEIEKIKNVSQTKNSEIQAAENQFIQDYDVIKSKNERRKNSLEEFRSEMTNELDSMRFKDSIFKDKVLKLATYRKDVNNMLIEHQEALRNHMKVPYEDTVSNYRSIVDNFDIKLNQVREITRLGKENGFFQAKSTHTEIEEFFEDRDSNYDRLKLKMSSNPTRESECYAKTPQRNSLKLPRINISWTPCNNISTEDQEESFFEESTMQIENNYHLDN